MKNEIIHTKYYHVDNGGFTFSVDRYGSVIINFGFFGYSDTQVCLSSNKEFSVDALADFFVEARFKLKNLPLEDN